MSKLFSKKLLLAPMAGFNDPAFRLLCFRHGADLAVTELTSADYVVSSAFKLDSLYKDGSEKTGIQLFGNNPEVIGTAGNIVQKKFDFVDFNMGCPSLTMSKQNTCGYLLGNYALTEKIFKSLRENVSKPLSLKLRLGINDDSAFLKTAKLAEQHGFDMITLHPRTVKQGYSGKADWSKIKKLKGSVNIPVTGNGDVNSPEKAKNMRLQTRCDNIMIGRYAVTNPYIFRDIKVKKDVGEEILSHHDKYDLLKEYLSIKKILEQKKVYTGLETIRQHAIFFSKEIKGGSTLRQRLSKAKTQTEILNILRPTTKKDG